MGTSNGGVMTDLPSSAGGRSQHQQARQSSRRPPRACTARTPSRLAPVAPSVERTPSRKQHGRPNSSRSDVDPPFTPMVLNSPPSPGQKDRWLLRSMWELASIIDFFNVFRSVLNIKIEFSLEELESALLTPDTLLDTIHIALLKAIPPISRNPLNRETWVPVLCKKMKDRWRWVAEDSFPLAPYHGEENATYRELDPDARVVILKALCEARLEQDDIRGFIDDMLKKGAPLSNIRKERTGSDTQGTTYWYENDPVAGQRLYRELRKSDNKEKSKVRGRLMPPPNPPQWETLATDLDEFLNVADKLCSSRNRMEIAIGKRINNDIVPDLEELQKKKERALKKQQRQALLLDSYLNTENMTSGRPRRDRKPVTYTFDDYDKSISEAIKITKRRNSSPELPALGERKMSNGVSRQHTEEVDANSFDDEEQLETASGVKHLEGTSPSKQYESAILSSESELSGARQFGRGQRLRKPQRYTESDFVDPTSDNEPGISSEEDIEGEAVYDDDYSSKRRRSAGSSDEDDEYKGDEDEEDEEDADDEDDDDYFGSSEEEDGWRGRNLKNTATARGKTRAKSKAAERSQSGLRRSQRATRSHIDYSKYEESDDGDENMKDAHSPDRADSDEGGAMLANGRDLNELEPRHAPSGQHWDNTDPVGEAYDRKDIDQGNGPLRTGKGVYEMEELHGGDDSHRPTNGVDCEPMVDVKPDVKVHRFLDLNVAAPMIGGLDDGCSKVYNHSLPFMVEKFENSGDDGSTSGSPKTSMEWPRR
ncbi:hypothetical protein GOP47_0016384 [Adiantum capillus-veneris]|uniref:DDT domain-containing protein n=1 Tax=Adiantum capillus-veneris TaxID=13818 RepID=A0A9D4UIE5_ADICA|nr:hypothetical protein GOP47_0016384 [Adiantum capillus-veneris]